MNTSRGKLLTKLALEKFNQTPIDNPEVPEKLDNYTRTTEPNTYSDEPDVEEPYPSSGSEYIPDSEVTDSADETMEQENNMEFDINVEKSEGRKKCGRKRKIKNQSRQDRKKCANYNLIYISARQKAVRPKIFKENYCCPCLKKCHNVVNDEIRKRFFNQFWNIGTFEGRCVLLSKSVVEVDKKRCYVKNKISRRSKSRQYYINNIPVCKDTFLNTLQINHNRVRVAPNQLKNDIIFLIKGEEVVVPSIKKELIKLRSI